MRTDKQIEKQIMDYVERDEYRPIRQKELAKRLKISDDRQRDFRRALKSLVKVGKLAWGAKHLVTRVTAKPSAKKPQANEVIGVFRRAMAGFGFVTPRESTATDRSDDIYIPKSRTGSAADGDLVRVRITTRKRGNDRRISGQIVEVIERRTRRFVGTYTEQDGYGIVIVDGGIFDSGILVGDAGAKDVRPGDKVVIEMVHFPSTYEDGEGVIVEVLGAKGQPGVDTLTVIREFDLPEEFPEAVLEDARQQADRFDEDDISGRTDFTQTTVITIDPERARDFDDAISLERIEKGHWRLGVHIADVAHFVPERSALDTEAYNRGTSVYLPDRVIPMLPEIISNNLASLQPHRTRYTMTAIIEFSPEGIPIGADFHRGAIKSAHRFTYEEVDDYLADDKPWKKKLEPDVFRLVRDMHTLAMILRQRRMERGAIELNLPDIEIDLDDNGRVIGAHVEENTESHQIIEEFMLAANEAVARHLADQGLYFLRRVHEPPAPTKLKELTEFVRHLGIECESLESRFEIKRVLELAEGRPDRHAIHYAILRSMQKAVYSPKELGHYALASDAYCHFTSPIRRYPDLTIHRMLADLIAGKKPKTDFNKLVALGQHCSQLEQRAEQAERELIKLKLLNYFSERIGEEMDAVITGVEAFGLFAQGIEIPVEGLIPVTLLPEDYYHFDRATRTLSGHHLNNQFRLGDKIHVRVAAVDTDRRQLEFELVHVGAKRRRGRSDRIDARSSRSRRASSNRSRESAGTGSSSRSRTSREDDSQTGSDRPRKTRSASGTTATAGTSRKSRTASSGVSSNAKKSTTKKLKTKKSKNSKSKSGKSKASKSKSRKSNAKKSSAKKSKAKKSTKSKASKSTRGKSQQQQSATKASRGKSRKSSTSALKKAKSKKK